METRVISYGERGVVNALVTDLDRRDDPVAAVKQLLRAVVWAGGVCPAWVDDVASVLFVVEVGLAEFGEPDLIIVCRTRAGAVYPVFVEAKVVPYLASAMPNSGGMVEGFNSSINGQLSLKYRFSFGLADWVRGKPQVVEPRSLFDAYAHPPGMGLGDFARQPRRLFKRTVLERILAKVGLQGVPADRCQFVALTWDREPFFAQQAVGRDLYPLFLTGDGQDAWSHVKARVGWLGYGLIVDHLAPGPAFRDALATMVASAVPAPADMAAAGRMPPLTSYKLERFGAGTWGLIEQLVASARERFGQEGVQLMTGSVSVFWGSKVILKLLPQEPGGDEHVLLGVSAVLQSGNWRDAPAWAGTFEIGSQPFSVLRLPAAAEDAVRLAQGILDQVKERLEPKNTEGKP